MPRKLFAKPLNGYKLTDITRPKFPHFTEEESYVLRKFIEANVITGEWYTDVKLTSRKASYVENMEEPWRTMWLTLTAKRIDAVCVSRDAVHIIEVKRVMLPSGVGQLQLYRMMFAEEYKPQLPIRLWYVTYYSDPDVEEMCRRAGIRTWSVVR